jgi:hypothetical protein
MNEETPVNREPSTSMRARWPLLLLFGTGLTSMGMEVVWIRELTPYVNTLVYSFACILATYLTATYMGSTLYRGWLRRRGNQPIQVAFWIWPLLGLLGVLSLWSCDPLVSISVVSRVFVGIAPFSGLLGFVTPMLVDLWAGNDPDRAGRAYAANVAGCIVGPLLAGFVLLPFFGERWSVLLFSMPWLAGAIVPARFLQHRHGHRDRKRHGEKTALRERRRHYRPHAYHQTHGAFALGFAWPTTKKHARYMFRHGNYLPLHAVVGYSDDRRGTRTQRAQTLLVLPLRWPRVAQFSTVARGD